MSRSAKSSQGKSEVAPISLILYFVMVLSTLAQVATTTAAPSPHPVSHVTCEDRLLVVAENSSSSAMVVQVESTQTVDANTYVADIPDSHVSSACTQGRHTCNAVWVGPHYLAVPGNRSVVLMKSSTEYFIEAVGACGNPIALHYDDDSSLLWVVCIGVSDNISIALYLVTVPDNGGEPTLSSITPARSNTPVGTPHPLFIADSPCESALLHVLIDKRVFSYEHDSGFLPGEELMNCSSVESLSYMEGSSFSVYCSNGLAALYDTCEGRWTYYPPSEDGRLLPCGRDLTVQVGREVISLMNSSGAVLAEERHEVGKVVRGRCSRDLVYLESADGAVYASRLGPGRTLRWLGPSRAVHLDRNGIVVLEEGGDVIVISAPHNCRNLAVEKRKISISNGILLPVTQFPGSHHLCSCAVNGERPTTPENPTTQGNPSSTRSSNKLSAGAVAGIAVASIAVVVVGILVALAICFKFGSKRCRSEGQAVESRSSSDTDIQPCDATGKDKGCVAIGLDLPHSSKNYSMQDVLAVSQPSGNEDARNDRTEKVNGVIQQNRT